MWLEEELEQQQQKREGEGEEVGTARAHLGRAVFVECDPKHLVRRALELDTAFCRTFEPLAAGGTACSEAALRPGEEGKCIGDHLLPLCS